MQLSYIKEPTRIKNLSSIKNFIACLWTKWRKIIRKNAYEVIDIIKELKSTNTVYYFDKICDVAERRYGFENTATRSYLDFCINYGFITLINSGDKLSFRVIL